VRALAIDTSTETIGLALCDGPTCVARTPFAGETSLAQSDKLGMLAAADAAHSGRPPIQHAERLFGFIDRLFAQAGWTKGDLELVACCVGPGSFTGVRVGVAAAKGIALALDLPIVGVGSLEAMARAHIGRMSVAGAADEAIVSLLDARKGEVFWAAYTSDGALLAGPGHIAAASIVELRRAVGRPKLTFLGDVAQKLGLDPASIVESLETDWPDPVEIVRCALAKLAERGPDDLDALEPMYVRPPDITLPSASS
jgi:tRNA threonylcarbamoyladenosine biosynthesis protein TsaB